MHDDLTAQDIEMMQKELDHRKLELMPELIEEVKRTRAFGDLSENFEYKAAKQAQNRNRSRIRYLERMIKSAHVIEDKAGADEVGLFDKVELLFEDDDDTDTIQVVTTVRCDPLNGRISCKAPLGVRLDMDTMIALLIVWFLLMDDDGVVDWEQFLLTAALLLFGL